MFSQQKLTFIFWKLNHFHSDKCQSPQLLVLRKLTWLVKGFCRPLVQTVWGVTNTCVLMTLNLAHYFIFCFVIVIPPGTLSVRLRGHEVLRVYTCDYHSARWQTFLCFVFFSFTECGQQRWRMCQYIPVCCSNHTLWLCWEINVTCSNL